MSKSSVDDENYEPDVIEFLNAWGDDLEAHIVRLRKAMKELTAAGCDRFRLLHLMDMLRDGRSWDRLSKQDAERIAAAFRRCAKAVEKLASADVTPVLFGQELRFKPDLGETAKRLAELAPLLHKSRNQFIDHAKALMVRYVKSATHRYHDAAVAALVDEMRPEGSKPYSAAANQRWRQDSKALIQGPLASAFERQWEDRVLEIEREAEAKR